MEWGFVMRDGEICPHGFLFLNGCCCSNCYTEKKEKEHIVEALVETRTVKWPTKEQVINAAKKDIAVNSDAHSYERYRGFIVGAAWMRAQVEVDKG